MTASSAARRAVAPAALAAGLYAAACVLPRIGLLHDDLTGDVALYQSYGDQILAGRIPYRAFFVEYPPAALLAFTLPSLFATGSYATAFQLLMAVLSLATIASLAFVLALCAVSRLQLWGGTAFAAVAPLLMGRTFLDRYDAFPTFLLVLALALLGIARYRSSLALLAFGTCAKIFPVVALPLFLLRLSATGGRPALRRGLVVFLAACLAVLVPFVILGPGGARFTTRVALTRPTQIESLGGSIAFLTDRIGILEITTRSEYDSMNVYGAGVWAISLASGAALVAALVCTWLAYSRSDRSYPRLAAATLASVAAAVAFGKVLSPQYLIWLIPLAPLALGRRSAVAACSLLAVALALTRLWFPGHLSELARLESESWVVVGRNIVLVALFVVAYLNVRRERSPADEPP